VAGLHDLAIAVPVPVAEALGNDQVERPAECLALRIAEDALGSRIPEDDRSVGAGGDDRIAGRLHELLRVEERTRARMTPSTERCRARDRSPRPSARR